MTEEHCIELGEVRTHERRGRTSSSSVATPLLGGAAIVKRELSPPPLELQNRDSPEVQSLIVEIKGFFSNRGCLFNHANLLDLAALPLPRGPNPKKYCLDEFHPFGKLIRLLNPPRHAKVFSLKKQLKRRPERDTTVSLIFLDAVYMKQIVDFIIDKAAQLAK